MKKYIIEKIPYDSFLLNSYHPHANFHWDQPFLSDIMQYIIRNVSI